MLELAILIKQDVPVISVDDEQLVCVIWTAEKGGQLRSKQLELGLKELGTLSYTRGTVNCKNQQR